jgi:uncharacterized protein (TIGR02271 family)
VEERARFGKRKVVTGQVRVTRVVQEHEEAFDEELLREDVKVTRVPVDRWVEAPVGIRRQGGTLIVPVMEEVLVVEKRLKVKEELHITKHLHKERSREQVTLRTEDARVQRVRPEGGTQEPGQGPGESGSNRP